MINFTRAFDSAWERMHIILFRPFDFGKWCAIGLSAFLAGFLQGGNGFNFSYNRGANANYNSPHLSLRTPVPNFDLRQFITNITHAASTAQAGMVVLIVLGVVVLFFGFILLFYWLGTRGQFMFLDNIVRNRGAISWPWEYYKRQANSLLGFYLLFLVISFGIFLPILAAMVVMCIPLYMQHRWPGGGEITGLVVLGLLYLVLALGMSILLFIFREFGIPIMFRQGLLARPAFWESMGLIRKHAGSVALFILLRIAIFIGIVILSLIVCCATCCIELIPYVGTVILLPVVVYVRCFTLDCLAQFGPEYDVWTVDVPPAAMEAQPPA